MSTPRLVFSWSESETGHRLFQVEQDAEGMWVCSRVLATFIPPGGDWLLGSCVEALTQQGWAWVPPDSDVLRESPASTRRLACRESNFLRHDTPAESLAATPAEAFSGERSKP